MNRIASLRKARKLNQKEFGSIIGVAQNTVCNWENENREPDYGSLKKMASFFDVSIDYLLGYTDKQEDSFSGYLLGQTIEQEKPTPENGDGLSEKDRRIATWFQSLSPEMRKAILTLGGGPEDLAE